MRIAIDTRDLLVALTGNKTYLEELCRAFPAAAPEHAFVFLRPRARPPRGAGAWQKALGHLAFVWWKEVQLPWRAWRAQCDVIFCTDYVAPLLASCPAIPVFHGANFWQRPEDYGLVWRALLNGLALPAARRAPAVVTVSESSRQLLARHAGIPQDKLRVVHEAPKLAASLPLTAQERQQILARHGVEAGTPFALHVGVMEKRKNLPRLIEAFALARPNLPQGFRLVLLGQAGPKKDLDDSANIRAAISAHGLESEVVLPGYVPDEELAAFYQAATLYVFPSLYEGFGLPALEAFANELPLLAARATSIPEVVGDAALLFDPLDATDIARALTVGATDEHLRADLVDRGLRRLADFSWEQTARQLVAIFEEAGNR